MISLTCNKKAYPEFREECNKCPMMIECVINGKSIAVGMLECPSVSLNIDFTPDIKEPTVSEIADRITQMLEENISLSIRA